MKGVAPGPTETADGNPAARDLPRGATVRYFGDYEIQKELGRGGMGVVYKARQVTLNRPVALKMIKAGVLADEAELRRFQNEAEAVALLDHAGIVPVYEVGDHDGQRYFSMKLVEGGNLAEQLGSRQADPRSAATLLAETAEAVHHAHMRGILHRDLKPANILIDAEGHPHVTDFGLAKRVEGDVEMTASGAILGTPAYVSPEQAAGRRGTITTATDVYGLGAILYALLTGKAPFGSDSLIDTLQAVKLRPPESPRSLNASVPRDLETICLKCLEKDPRRRYASAQALADDLHCWLDSRPIAARRVGPAERAWLWCKRKPAVAALAAAVVLAVVAGTAGIFAVQASANASLRSANSKLDRANTALKSSNTLLDQQRERAEDREKQAIDAVKKFRDAVTDNPELKDNPSLEALRKVLLKEPLAFFRSLRDRLQPDKDTRPESLARLAEASSQLGRLSNEIGDKLDALTAFRESLSIRQALADAHPAVAQYQVLLANSHNSLGFLMSSTGQADAARRAHEAALAIRHALANTNPSVTQYHCDLAQSHSNLGGLLSASGQPGAARKAYELALAIRQKLADAHPTVTRYQMDLARSHHDLGNLLRATGKPVESLQAFESALAIVQRTAREHPESPDYSSNLGGSLNDMALIDIDANRFDAARERLRQAIVWQKKALAGNSRHPQYRRFLANHLTNLIEAARASGHDDEATAAQRELVELQATDPRMIALDARLAAVLNGEATRTNAERVALAQRAYDTRRFAAAAKLWADALEADPKLADDRQTAHRYNAACAAALAATTPTEPSPIEVEGERVDDAAKVRLRAQAIDWLKAELAVWAKFVASGPPQAKAFIAQTMKHWQEHTDLAGVRGDKATEALPEPERAAWRRLWADVAALLERARTAAGRGK